MKIILYFDILLFCSINTTIYTRLFKILIQVNYISGLGILQNLNTDNYLLDGII